MGSVWSKEKKRAQKITKRYLGRITEDGLIAPKAKRERIVTSVSVKEYGASSVISKLGNDIFTKLKEIFPNQAETLFALAALRVIEPNPFKRAQAAYDHSFLSETFKGLRLSGKDIRLIVP